MGALAENFKRSKVGQVMGGAWMAFAEMINFQDDGDLTVEEAIKSSIKENPEIGNELNKFKKINEINEKVLQEKEEEIFGIESVAEKDGYNPLENKLQGLDAKVSEEEARKVEKPRNGKQKTRVDED